MLATRQKSIVLTLWCIRMTEQECLQCYISANLSIMSELFFFFLIATVIIVTSGG